MSTLLEKKKKEIFDCLVRFRGNKVMAAGHLEMSLRSLIDLINHDPMFHRFKHYTPLSAQSEKPTNLTEKTQMNQVMLAPKTEETEITETFNTGEIAKTLHGLMNKVTEKNYTPDTVNAACNCAGRIIDLIRVHVDYKRLQQKFK